MGLKDRTHVVGCLVRDVFDAVVEPDAVQAFRRIEHWKAVALVKTLGFFSKHLANVCMNCISISVVHIRHDHCFQSDKMLRPWERFEENFNVIAQWHLVS